MPSTPDTSPGLARWLRIQIVVISIFVMIFLDLIQFPMKVLFIGMKWRDSLQISEEDYRVITLGIPIEFS